MPVPVIENYTFEGPDEGDPDSTITLTKPAGLAVGDLSMAVVCTDHDDGPAWEAKAGWTLLANSGTSDSDTCLGVYYRITDGTEGATEDFDCNATDDLIGWWIRISGVNTADPIHNTSGDDEGGSSGDQPHEIIGHNTTVDDVLAMWMLNFDGADGEPWFISWSGAHTFVYGETAGSTVIILIPVVAGAIKTWSPRELQGHVKLIRRALRMGHLISRSVSIPHLKVLPLVLVKVRV